MLLDASSPYWEVNANCSLQKLKQMKASGVPPNDPEYIKHTQFLHSFQQQQQLRKQQQQYMQHQQQQQQQQHSPNGPVNGAQPGTPQAQQTIGAPASNGPQALNSGAPTNGVPTGGPSSSHFTQQQLGLLRQQISAFKMLGKNNGVPAQMQQLIQAQRQRRQAAALESAQAANKSSQSNLDATKGTDGTDPTTSDDAIPKPHTYKTVKSPYSNGMIRPSIKYLEHAQRKNRYFIPGVFPTGIDFDHLRYEREVVVFNRMSQRYNELKSLPANMAHWDATKESLEADDTLKRKAIIEMKSLALYAKQRALRDKIGRQMLHYDNLAMTTNRSGYRRMKKQSVREARITEKL